jgi:fatty-acyl-CoA synthase
MRFRKSVRYWSPVNYRLTPDDFSYIINHSGARVVCAHADYLEAVDDIRAATGACRAFRCARRYAARSGFEYERLVDAAVPRFKRRTSANTTC